ncbi:MAG: glycosyltransferase family 4 protein [Kordiimonas sp.]
MKITFVGPYPNLSGGVRVIATIANKLQDRGHDVCVVAPREAPPTKLDWLRALKKGRRPLRAHQKNHYDHMDARLILLEHSGPISNDDVPDADVIIATWWETAFSVTHFSPSKGRKFYFIQGHEVHDFLPNHISAGSYYLPLNKIVVSSWLEKLMKERYAAQNVTVVPNSVDTSLFHAPYRQKQPHPTIGLMYANDPLKGLDVSLTAINLIKKKHPDLQVVSFGAHPTQRAMPLPSGATYIINPPQDQIRQIYANCDVFIAGSYAEGFGLPILEALACRSPVVATRTGCTTDVIEEGQNGFIVDVGDAAGMADKACKILSLTNEAWMRMSTTARKSATSYSWEDAAVLFEKALMDEQ